jgi:hypothetical protein
MLPLYAARIEDLGQGDFVKVDCATCHHVALLATAERVSPASAPMKPGGARLRTNNRERKQGRNATSDEGSNRPLPRPRQPASTSRRQSQQPPQL